MLNIPVLRTTRFTCELKELTIGQSIELANMPVQLLEATNTQLLRNIIKSVKGVDADPLNWTVQERTHAVAFYMSATNGGDFPIGAGNFSDYLAMDLTLSNAFTKVEIGELGGDSWSIQHLTGLMVESIERLEGNLQITPRLHWLIGGMAAQLVRGGEKLPARKSEQDYDDWLLNRMETFLQLSESDFESLMIAYRVNKSKLDHLLRIDFDDSGIIVLPTEREGGTAGLPPTRFRAFTCLSRTAQQLGGVAE